MYVSNAVNRIGCGLPHLPRLYAKQCGLPHTAQPQTHTNDKYTRSRNEIEEESERVFIRGRLKGDWGFFHGELITSLVINYMSYFHLSWQTLKTIAMAIHSL